MSSQKGKEPIRIAVVDDDTAARKYASNHINPMEDCEVMMMASDGQEFLDKLQINPQIDLVILDVMMNNGLGGYATAQIIRKKYPSMRILFYSICKTELAFSRMAACGGHGLIMKWKGSLKITEAIRAVMNGHYFFPDIEEEMAIGDDGFSAEKYHKLVELSPLEINFLELIGTEKTYKEMADYLQIGFRQVDSIREALFKLLNVKNRVAMGILAHQSGIVPLPLYSMRIAQ